MIGSPKITLGMVLFSTTVNAMLDFNNGAEDLVVSNPLVRRFARNLLAARAATGGVQNAKCQDPAHETYNPITKTCEKLCAVQGAPADCDENTGFTKSGPGSLQTQFGIGSAKLKGDCAAAETLIEGHDLFFWNWDVVPGMNCGNDTALATKLGNVLSGKDESGKKVKAAKFFPMAWGTGQAGGVQASATDGHEVIMGYNEADMHGSNPNGLTWDPHNTWAPKCSDSGRNMFDYRDGFTCATEATSAGMFNRTSDGRPAMFAPEELLQKDWKLVSDNQHTFYEAFKVAGGWPEELKPQVQYVWDEDLLVVAVGRRDVIAVGRRIFS